MGKGESLDKAVIEEELGEVLSYKYCYYVSGRAEAPRLARQSFATKTTPPARSGKKRLGTRHS